jgi:hypothetical protein
MYRLDPRPIAATYDEAAHTRETLRREISNADKPHTRVLEGELLDLYVAILVAVPLMLVLKSLWS